MRNLLQRLLGIWQEATAVFSPHPAQLFQAPLEKFYGIAPSFVDDISGEKTDTHPGAILNKSIIEFGTYVPAPHLELKDPHQESHTRYVAGFDPFEDEHPTIYGQYSLVPKDLLGASAKYHEEYELTASKINGRMAADRGAQVHKEMEDRLGYEFVLPPSPASTTAQDVPGKGKELFTVKIAKEDMDQSRITEEEVEKIKQSLYGEDLYFRNWDGAGIRLVVDDRPTVGDRFTRIEQEVDRMVAIEKMQEEYPIEYINDFIKTRNVDTNLVSDGHHTFGELYEHRIELYMALCREWNDTGKHLVWRSQKHHDDSVWEGWFIMGVNKASGEQISYHLPEKYWYTCASFAIALDKAPEWDGHSSSEVLKRLRKL